MNDSRRFAAVAGLLILLLALWAPAACAPSPTAERTATTEATGAEARAGAAPRPANVPEAWDLFGETVRVVGSRAMVVSGSPLASEVGRDVLQGGGNAVDAAVAVGFALAVVHPEAGNIGGGGFMVVHRPGGGTTTLDFRETAPGGATRDMYLGPDGKITRDAVLGHLSSGVPGTVAGLAKAQERYGTISLAEVLEPAIRLAREGFVLDEYRAGSIERSADRLSRFEASAEQFLVEGEAPEPGDRLVQSDLAETLELIAEEGPETFYTGSVADLIVAEMERGGGLITADDLASYEAIWRQPITIRYRGRTIHSMPPSSSGGIALAEILNILEGFDPLPEFASPEMVHLQVEADRRAFVDRNHYLGDPAFVDMPVATLTSEEYAAKRRASIVRDRATPTEEVEPGVREGVHTTHYSVVAEDGSAVSVTTTLNSSYGSGVTVAGAGFLLNNEMDDFTSAPGEPNQYGLIQGEANAIEPGKRMLSAMTPTIVLDGEGRLEMVLGTPGGPTIITTVSQVILNVVDHGMALTTAVAAPRLHHQGLPDVVFHEADGLLPETISQLEQMGHALREASWQIGDVAAIGADPEGWVGVADPRRGAAAAGY